MTGDAAGALESTGAATGTAVGRRQPARMSVAATIDERCMASIYEGARNAFRGPGDPKHADCTVRATTHWRSSFMARRIMTAASAAAVLALCACARGPDNAYDTAGTTAGAMATPPAIGLSVGATTGMTTGMTTLTRDTTKDTTKTP
jgi:hypothetical protein